MSEGAKQNSVPPTLPEGEEATKPAAGAVGDPAATGGQDPKNVQELTGYIQTMLQQMQERFQLMSDQIISRIEDMGARIDDMEHNINDLMTQAGNSSNTGNSLALEKE